MQVVSFSDGQGTTITRAEWATRFVTLTKAQAAVVAKMREGYALVVDQYTGKNWIERGDDRIPVRNPVVTALYENYLLDERGSTKMRGPADYYGKSRIYTRTTYHLIRGY